MILEAFHQLKEEDKKLILFSCCGSTAWVNKMLKMPKLTRLDALLAHAEQEWFNCSEEDWRESFTHHPKIGDIDALQQKFASDEFAGKEQAGIIEAPKEILQSLLQENKTYEERFGYNFIVCASGKSAADMLQLLQSRQKNEPVDEIKVAMEELNRITKLRLMKLFRQ